MRIPEASARRCARRARRIAMPLAGTLLAASALAACGGGSNSAGGSADEVQAQAGDVESGAWGATLRPGGTPRHGGTLTIDQATPPLTLSAYRMMERPNTPDLQVGAQIYNQLVEYLPGHFDPQPGLARSWDVSRDGLTYTFHLQPNVTFSDGQPFTSEDVKFTLDHARGPKSFFKDSLYGVIASVDTPDPLTAVVTLSTPTPGFIYALGNISASIVPKRLIESEGVQAYNAHPIGTGAFTVKRWVKDQQADLVRNPTYWRGGGRPYLDALRFRVTTSDNTRILNVSSGSTDVADTVPFSQIKSINAGDKAKVLVGAGGDMYVIWTNNGKRPFSEPEVRQALAYATPLRDINDVAFGGVAPLMNTVYPKVKYWNADNPGYTYDLAKARALLARSSVPNGFSTTINLVGTDQPSNQVAQIVQQSWARLGIKVKIQRLDNTTLGTRWAAGNHDMTLYTPGAFSTDVPVDDEFTTLLFNSPATNNLYTFLRDPEARKLTQQATTTMDEAKRRALFHQLQLVSIRDPPVIPLVYTPNRAAVANDVHNLNYMMAGSYWRLDGVWKD